LYLWGTAIKELPEGLSVGGSLYLRGTAIKELPEGLSVRGDLDLRETAIKELPEGLSVGGNLDLEGTAINNYPLVYNCGNQNRAIYLDLKDKTIIHIGCFKGTKQEALSAVSMKYGRSIYYQQIIECFGKGEI
jgi:hypothetical protein